MTTFILPFPPSVNTYWRRVGNRTVLSKKAREYRANVAAVCAEQRAPRLGTARLRVKITAHPPDKRQRDLDNLPKGLLDALAFARVFDDDSQIDSLHIVRAGPTKPGKVVVTLETL